MSTARLTPEQRAEIAERYVDRDECSAAAARALAAEFAITPDYVRQIARSHFSNPLDIDVGSGRHWLCEWPEGCVATAARWRRDYRRRAPEWWRVCVAHSDEEAHPLPPLAPEDEDAGRDAERLVGEEPGRWTIRELARALGTDQKVMGWLTLRHGLVFYAGHLWPRVEVA